MLCKALLGLSLVVMLTARKVGLPIAFLKTVLFLPGLLFIFYFIFETESLYYVVLAILELTL